jgi:hypothetical protein
LKNNSNLWETFAEVMNSLVAQICQAEPESICELMIILSTLTELVKSLKQEIEPNFEQIWGFISTNVFCIDKCSLLFNLLDQETLELAFKLTTLMVTHFENNRDFLFTFLNTIIQNNENKSLYITRTSKMAQNSPYMNNNIIQQSQKNLENMIMGNFYEIVSNSHWVQPNQKTPRILPDAGLCASPEVASGLFNLGATCYFNSMIQQFANMKWFVDLVLRHCAQKAEFEFVEKITKGSVFMIL